MTRTEVENAAFWGLAICLDCPAVVDGESCPECGSDTMAADTVVKVLDVVKEDEE